MTANEIAAFLESCGVDKVRIGTTEVIGCCPVHHETRPSFGVAVNKPGHPYNCFACHSSGLLPKVVMHTHGLSWKQALQRVMRFGDYSVEDIMFEADQLAAVTKDMREVDVEMRGYMGMFDTLNIKSRQYLKSRRIRSSVAVSAGVMRFEGRLIIPWYENNRLVGMTSRSYREAKDRYRGLPLFGFKKHQHLYNPTALCPRKEKMVVVVEGEMDALRVESLGYSARALSGTKVTTAQIKALSRMDCPLVILMDADKEGDDARDKLVNALGSSNVVLLPAILPEKYSDPADLCKSDANALFFDGNLQVAGTLCF